MFASSLPKQIYKNASLGQKKLVKANKNGTRLALKLVWSQEIEHSNKN